VIITLYTLHNKVAYRACHASRDGRVALVATCCVERAA